MLQQLLLIFLAVLLAIVFAAWGSDGAATIDAGDSTSESDGTPEGDGTSESSSDPPGLAALSVTPANPVIDKGTVQQFAATGSYTDDSEEDITSQVEWSSSGAMVTVDSSGVASASEGGTVTITATDASSGLSGEPTLSVAFLSERSAANPKSVSLSTEFRGEVGATSSFHVTDASSGSSCTVALSGLVGDADLASFGSDSSFTTGDGVCIVHGRTTQESCRINSLSGDKLFFSVDG